MDRQRVQIDYSGHVQGVGFRYTVKRLAVGYEITGTIRNRPDGKVELLAEGSRDELQAFAQAVLDSGLGPLIRDQQIRWQQATNEFRGFTIVG